eukprot:72257-Prorocentrum_minimum.AAC.1
MGAAALLQGLVRAPGELQREVQAAALVLHAAVRLQADAGGGRLADDGDELVPRHEALPLRHVHQLGADALAALGVLQPAPLRPHHLPRPPGHLRHRRGAAQHVRQLV